MDLLLNTGKRDIFHTKILTYRAHEKIEENREGIASAIDKYGYDEPFTERDRREKFIYIHPHRSGNVADQIGRENEKK